MRERLVEQIAQLDRQLKAISIAPPACQLLMSIPGVGVQTSAAFAAAVDDASRFRRSRTTGAYFGLVPRRHQSGELDWTGRITKQGDSTVRKLLYEAANSILTRAKTTFALKSWALKVARRRGLRRLTDGPLSPLRVKATPNLVKPDTAPQTSWSASADRSLKPSRARHQATADYRSAP